MPSSWSEVQINIFKVWTCGEGKGPRIIIKTLVETVNQEICSNLAFSYQVFKKFFLVKCFIYLSYYLAIPFLGIYSREMEAYVHTKTCTLMFRVAFFHSSQTISISRWELRHIQTIFITKHKLLTSTTTWLNFRNIVLSERSQTKKKKVMYSMISLIWNSGTKKTSVLTESRSVFTWHCEWRHWLPSSTREHVR